MSERIELVGRPAIVKEFSGLKTITRIYKVIGAGSIAANIDTDVFIPFGTADNATTPPGEYALALLTAQRTERIRGGHADESIQLTRVFQEFTPTTLVNVGDDQLTKLEDGRTQLVRTFVALASEAEGLAPAIGTVVDGRAVSNVVVRKNGVGAQVIVTYISAGKLAESTRESNNGALTVKTLTYFNEVPPTPAGFVLVDERVQSTEGVPTYTYTFARGDGEVSRRIDYSQSSDQGTTGVTRTVITHLTSPAVSSNPTALGGSVLIGIDVRDDDGHRVWTATYAKGTGVVAERIDSRNDGLRAVTYVSLGTRVAPTGVVVRDDMRKEAGFDVFTVTTMQSADGGAPTSATLTAPVTVPFTYPGRAKAYTKAASNGWTIADVFRSPPIQTEVEGEVSISYQTSAALGVLTHARWQPREWATIEAEFITLSNRPRFIVQALPGYRSVSETPISYTADIWADDIDGTMLGELVYGGTTAKLTVFGGPADPGGSTWTLDARLDLAFVDTAGTKYYRKTVVTAAIPAQDALPV